MSKPSYVFVLDHIKDHYPEFHFDHQLIDVTQALFLELPFIPSIRYVLDNRSRKMVYIEGCETLGYHRSEWDFDHHRQIIPGGYTIVNSKIAEESYVLYYNHKLKHWGFKLRMNKDLILKSADGKYYLATHVSFILLADEIASPVLTAGTYLLRGEWDGADPLILRPAFWKGKNQDKTLDQILFNQVYTYDFITRDLGIQQEWFPVLLCNMLGMKNADIAKACGLKLTKSNYYNTRIMETFEALFLTPFPTAEACGSFLVKMGADPKKLYLHPESRKPLIRL